jgi:hypothetical protein
VDSWHHDLHSPGPRRHLAALLCSTSPDRVATKTRLTAPTAERTDDRAALGEVLGRRTAIFRYYLGDVGDQGDS